MAKNSQRAKRGSAKREGVERPAGGAVSGDEPASGSPGPTSSAGSFAHVGAFGSAFLAGALAIYQWIELVNVKGGATAACAINATFNCTSVWDAPIAKLIQSTTRVPIAGWGLIWALGGASIALLARGRARRDGRSGPEGAALKLFALAGILSSLALFGVSASMGVWCITCLMTYVLAASFAYFAWKAPGPEAGEWSGGVARSVAAVVVAYLLLLYPGTRTPLEAAAVGIQAGRPPHEKGVPPGADAGAAASRDPRPDRPERASGDLLADFLSQLPEASKQSVSDSLAAYRREPLRGMGAPPPRRLLGSPSAPVQILEWSDIRCGHCKSFSETLHEIEASASAEQFAVELRQFPIDSGCNTNVSPDIKDPTGVRCTAARALICLEPTPAFRMVQSRLFAEQERLTLDRVWELAGTAGVPREELRRCLESPETTQKLVADIAYAMSYRIDGTPLVVINGRRAAAVGPFVYAMILANGNVDAPGWSVLPPAEG